MEEVNLSIDEVLTAMGEAMPALFEPLPPETDPALAETTFVGTIDIIGDEPATATITVEGTTCGHLAVGWGLVEGSAPSIEDAADAMSEFVNIVGGSIKTIFDTESSLGLPSVGKSNEPVGAGADDPDTTIVHHVVGSIQVHVKAHESHR